MAKVQLRIDENTLRDLINMETDFISQKTYTILLRLIPEDKLHELHWCLEPLSEHQLREIHDHWMDERKARLINRKGSMWALTGQYFDVVPDPKRHRAERLYAVIGLCRTINPYRELFELLEETIETQGFDRARFELCCIRVVEPLLEDAESVFMELGFDDLWQTERNPNLLEQFLQQGVKQEIVLLAGLWPFLRPGYSKAGGRVTLT